MLLKCVIGQKSPSTLIASEPLITLRTHFTASVYEDRSGAVKKHSDSHRWVLDSSFLVHQIGGAFFCDHLKFLSTHSLRYLYGNSALTRPMEIHPTPTPWVGCSQECEHERHMLRICPGLGPVLFLRQYQPTLLSAIFNHNPSLCPLGQT